MTNFTTMLSSALIQKQDLDDFFCRQLETAINDLLQAELTEFLGYEAYARAGADNYRNGDYSRQFSTKYGQLTLTIPRDRLGDFHQQTLPSYARASDDLATTVIQLYEHGVTHREISDLIWKMYGHHYSPQSVSNIVEIVNEQVDAFQKRELKANYAFVYLDATHLPLRRDSVRKEAVHLAIGMTQDGKKEILGYQIAPEESREVYQALITDMKQRGLEQVLMFISDGMKGLSELLSTEFPDARQQRCWVHVARTINARVRLEHRAAIMSDFRYVHQAEDKKEAQERLQSFIESWQKLYPKLSHWIPETNLFSYYDFPEVIRVSIYTNNLIEAYNKELKRQSKKHIQYPNEASLDRFLVTQFMSYNSRQDGRTHKGFKDVSDTLESMFA